VTLLGRWQRPKHSSDHAMTENALRCCLHISSVSYGSAACDCAGLPSSSSRWRRSRRTSAGWPRSSPDHHRCPAHVWREASGGACARLDGASASASRLIGFQRSERQPRSGSSARWLTSLIATFTTKSARTGLADGDRECLLIGGEPDTPWKRPDVTPCLETGPNYRFSNSAILRVQCGLRAQRRSSPIHG
jgi:hypothetical protein